MVVRVRVSPRVDLGEYPAPDDAKLRWVVRHRKHYQACGVGRHSDDVVFVAKVQAAEVVGCSVHAPNAQLVRGPQLIASLDDSDVEVAFCHTSVEAVAVPFQI